MQRLVIFIAFAVLITSISASADTIIPAGPVSGTWDLAGSPYLVEGEIILNSNQTLTIDPGVDVIFQGHYKFIVYGMLQALGTDADSITFTAANTSTGWHGFRFYYLNTQPDSSRLAYCVLEYGRSSSDNYGGEDKNGGVVYATNSDLIRFSNCVFRYNQTGSIVGLDGFTGGYPSGPGGPGGSVSSGHGGATYLDNSSIVLESCSFINNKTGNAIGGNGGEGGDEYTGSWQAASGGDGGTGGNGTSGQGGALYIRNCSPRCENCQFVANGTGTGTGGVGGDGGNAQAGFHSYAWGGDGGAGGTGNSGLGGAVYLSSSTPISLNILLTGNQTGDCYGGDGGDGGWGDGDYYGYGGNGGSGGDAVPGDACALLNKEEIAMLSNLTIVDNYCGDPIEGEGGYGGGGYSGGGGGQSGTSGEDGIADAGEGTVVCDLIGSVELSSSILWANVAPLIQGNVIVNYSCIEGGFSGTGNIAEDPLFIGNPTGDYFLSQIAAGQLNQSPCVDAGDPVAPLIMGTTRTDFVLDEGVIDMGYHHLLNATQPALLIDPVNLEYYLATGGPNPADTTFYIYNWGPGTFNYELFENADWLYVSNTSGGPVPPTDSVTVTIDIAGLSSATYEEGIVVSAPGAIGSPDTVYVTLQLADAELVANPDELQFTTYIGGGNPQNRSVNLSNTGPGNIEYSVEYDAEWLNVTPESGGPLPPSETLDVSVDITGLPSGTYEEDVIIRSTSGYGMSDTLHVLLTIYSYQPISGVLYGVLQTGTYLVTNHIMVLDFSSLFIEYETTLLFDGPYRFSVMGNLEVMGFESDSVKFISADESVPWRGIKFIEGDGFIQYCRISGSDSSGIVINDCEPVFEHCTISHNSNFSGGGLSVDAYLYTYQPQFTNCLFSDNTADGAQYYTYGIGGGIFCYSSNVLFTGCIIDNNRSQRQGNVLMAMGGGLGCHNDISVFTDCIISNNIAIGSDLAEGGGIWVFGGEPTFDHCTIFGNTCEAPTGHGGGGFWLDGDCEPALINCTIDDNTLVGAEMDGGGIYWDGDSCTITNSIFSNNLGEGIFTEGSFPSVDFCDFYGNREGPFGGSDPGNLGVLSQTNVNGDSCDVFYNIYMDPMFYSTSGDSAYRLTGLSPCIDAGDPTSPFDPDNTFADLGAYYFDQNLGIAAGRSIEIPDEFCLFPAYPNPFNPSTTIRFGLPVTSQVSLAVYNVRGERVADLVNGFRVAGYHNVTWDAGGLASGMFFAVIHAGDFQAIRKVMLVK